MGLMSLAKVIVVVDEGIDVRNTQEAWWYALGNIDPERDVKFTKGPVDDLDHAAQNPSFGSKMGIDGTRKWPEEGFTRRWPEMIEMDADVKAHVDGIWARLGIEPID
jgi:4-hydroxy-3-polyprenylbenzoate decarboxylase